MNRFIRMLSCGLIAVIIATGVSVQSVHAAGADVISVYFNEKKINFTVDPFMESGTTMVEFRPIFEQLGLTIGWDGETDTITGTKNNIRIQLTIGSKLATVNDETHELQVAPVVKNDRTLVPIRFVSEAAGSYVEWVKESQTIRMYRLAPEATSVSDNWVLIEGRVPANSDSVRIKVMHMEKEKYFYDYLEPMQGRVRHELYLPYGSGIYNIQIYHSKMDEYYSYTNNTEFEVTNDGNSGVNLSSIVTDDGKVRLFGDMTKDVQTVIVMASLASGELHKWAYFETVDGKLDKDLYLNLGPGEYDLDIYTTPDHHDDIDPENATYLDSITVVNKDTRDPDLLPSELVESEHPEIVQLAQEITANYSIDRLKSRAIHDWVASNIAYDAATYLSGGDREDSALETLRGRIADCDGYARLNVALHRAVGIKARIVLGAVIDPESGETWDDLDPDEINHAWNEVWIEDRWVTHDPTWNAGYIDYDTDQYVPYLTHDYYDPSPSSFALDHRAVNLEYKYE